MIVGSRRTRIRLVAGCVLVTTWVIGHGRLGVFQQNNALQSAAASHISPRTFDSDGAAVRARIR